MMKRRPSTTGGIVTMLILMLGVSASHGQSELKPVESGVYRWDEAPVKQGDKRESRTFLQGTSPNLEFFRIHATTQLPGATPGNAHANEDAEECIIVKEGTMKITIEDQGKLLGPGGVILLMPQQMHSIENVGDQPLSYYVMKYKSRKPMSIERGQTAGGSLMLDPREPELRPSARGGGRAYFDRETAMCERFEMHVTRLDRKGPSHDPHQHEESEIILVISGDTEITIDGKEYRGSAGDFYFMETPLMHGVRNATDNPCTYFAFKWK
jgi:quercetin dioxygenase-like cupin family protein